jgi:hypothetical protein
MASEHRWTKKRIEERGHARSDQRKCVVLIHRNRGFVLKLLRVVQARNIA